MATTKTTTKKTTTAKKVAVKAPRVAKTYNFLGFKGLANTSLNRATGSQISIWNTAQAPQFKGELEWTVECETHGTTKQVAIRSAARDLRMDPTQFCTKCKTAAAAKAKGAAVKDAPAKKAASTKKATTKARKAA